MLEFGTFYQPENPLNQLLITTFDVLSSELYTLHIACRLICIQTYCFGYLVIVGCHFLVCFSGIDASAQTSSHEMTIPNDVSTSKSQFLSLKHLKLRHLFTSSIHSAEQSCSLMLTILFENVRPPLMPSYLLTLLLFSTTAYWVHHRPPGSQDQRDQANVGRPDQDCESSGWID